MLCKDLVLTMIKAILPNAMVVSHRDFQEVHKECPWYDAQEEFKHFNRDITDKSLLDPLRNDTFIR